MVEGLQKAAHHELYKDMADRCTLPVFQVGVLSLLRREGVLV